MQAIDEVGYQIPGFGQHRKMAGALDELIVAHPGCSAVLLEIHLGAPALYIFVATASKHCEGYPEPANSHVRLAQCQGVGKGKVVLLDQSRISESIFIAMLNASGDTAATAEAESELAGKIAK